MAEKEKGISSKEGKIIYPPETPPKVPLKEVLAERETAVRGGGVELITKTGLITASVFASSYTGQTASITTTGDTDWHDITSLTLTFTVNVDKTQVVFVTLHAHVKNTGAAGLIAILVDSVEKARATKDASTNFTTISCSYTEAMTAGSHTIKGSFATGTGAQTTELTNRGLSIVRMGIN